MKRFWDKVDKTGDCWEWKAALNEHGYGMIGMNGGMRRAHRLSWEFRYGKIPDGLFVLHKCDNPKCVNPDHLFLGNQTDNMHDCSLKGRTKNTPQLGEKNVFAVLDRFKVLEIRALDGIMLQKDIAKTYNVKDSAISKIILRRTWRHI